MEGKKSPETHAGRPERLLALEIALTISHSSLGFDVLLGPKAVFKLYDFEVLLVLNLLSEN